MNRAARRAINKKLGKGKKLSPEVFALLAANGGADGNLKDHLAAMAAEGEDMLLKEGEKVRLNIKEIKTHPDWHKKTEKYKDFVENNSNTIFTVKYDDAFQDPPTLVCLVEDEEKWLWYEGYLIRINDDKSLEEVLCEV